MIELKFRHAEDAMPRGIPDLGAAPFNGSLHRAILINPRKEHRLFKRRATIACPCGGARSCA
jgi:hypothetical protein